MITSIYSLFNIKKTEWKNYIIVKRYNGIYNTLNLEFFKEKYIKIRLVRKNSVKRINNSNKNILTENTNNQVKKKIYVQSNQVKKIVKLNQVKKKEYPKKKKIRKFNIKINNIVYDENHPFYNENNYDKLNLFNLRNINDKRKIFELINKLGWKIKNSNNHLTFKRNNENFSCGSTPKSWIPIFKDLKNREIIRIENEELKKLNLIN